MITATRSGASASEETVEDAVAEEEGRVDEEDVVSVMGQAS
jgi:hypothetical protein